MRKRATWATPLSRLGAAPKCLLVLPAPSSEQAREQERDEGECAEHVVHERVAALAQEGIAQDRAEQGSQAKAGASGPYGQAYAERQGKLQRGGRREEGGRKREERGAEERGEMRDGRREERGVTIP